MCGITGFITKSNIGEKELVKMRDSIAYRGPDDSGVYLYPMSDGKSSLGFAHVRLSILDLSPLGHQPMECVDGRYVITYNGEIYNFKELKSELEGFGYKFLSNCDTEIVPAAFDKWGIDCAKKFNGMFAFAIFDKLTEKLTLIRDRLGVKPLYWYKNGDDFVFASEMKPIYLFPGLKKEINPNALGNFLSTQYITGPETILNNVYKLKPGCCLVWEKGDITITPYWSIIEAYNKGKNSRNNPVSFNDALNELDRLVTDATRLRMISDVPLGAFLSGGIDSSLITAVMQKLSDKPVKTFTIGFTDSGYDESVYAAEVSKVLGTDHTCELLPLSTAREYIDLLPEYYDEPMADQSSIATLLLSKITRENVTVALTGDAGDELFCGYERYGTNNGKYKIPAALLNAANVILPIKGSENRYYSKLIHCTNEKSMINMDTLAYWDVYNGIIKDLPENPTDMLKDKLQAAGKSFCEKYMLSDLGTNMIDDILVKVDRASMGFSLETRSPLLDYRIVEFALGLPLDYKYNNGSLKHILKELAYTYVPKELLDRPKQGFGVPVGKWMHEDLAGFAKGTLEKQYIDNQGIFDYSVVDKMQKAFHRNKYPVVDFELWNLIVFQQWYEKYMG